MRLRRKLALLEVAGYIALAVFGAEVGWLLWHHGAPVWLAAPAGCVILAAWPVLIWDVRRHIRRR